MIKFFWYVYFAIYLGLASISRFRLAYLRRVDNKAADEYAYKQVQKISKHVLFMSRTKVTVIGKENIPKEACAFVSNHQAIFDAFVITAYIDNLTGFIAKKEISKIPLISGFIREIHSVYIDRNNIKDGIKAINEGVDNIKKGYSMVIFPEGTRSLSSEMGEFKKGSLKLALKGGAPIVPISINGTYRVLEVGNKVRGNEITIMFHEPIYPDKLTKEEQKSITDVVYSVVYQGLQEILNKTASINN
jgi:1-acyl-sn-glycerol-3-phosphate acyltransferase